MHLMCVCVCVCAGGAFPYTIGRIEHGFNCRPDLCAVDCQVNPRTYLGRIFTDSLVHDPAALRYLVEVIGQVGASLYDSTDLISQKLPE